LEPGLIFARPKHQYFFIVIVQCNTIYLTSMPSRGTIFSAHSDTRRDSSVVWTYCWALAR